jgi:hypothetical protein
VLTEALTFPAEGRLPYSDAAQSDDGNARSERREIIADIIRKNGLFLIEDKDHRSVAKTRLPYRLSKQ